MASAGTAYVDVEAKLDSFGSEIDAAVSALDTQTIDVEAVASTDQAQAEIDSIEGGTTEIAVEANTEAAQQGIDGLSESVGGLVDNMGGGGGGDALAGFADSAGLLGVSSMSAATGGVAALGVGLGYAASEAMDAEAVVAQLDQMVANVGSNAGVTSGGLQALATDIQQTAGFSDEAVMSGESMVLMFENVRNVAGSPIFDRTIKASADLARSPAFNGDIAGAARTLGRAIDDPTAGMGRLRRAGIQLSEGQQEQIRSLQESGDVLGAQAALLDVVEGKVNGLAEAYGDTLAGSLDRTKEKLGENAEQIGGIVLPAVNLLVGGISDLAGTAYDLGYALGEGWQGRAMQGPTEYIQGLGTVVGGLPPQLRESMEAMNDVTAAADDAGFAVSDLGSRIESYLTGTYRVPEAQRAVRDSFHDLFQTLLTEGHTADDVAVSMQSIVTRTAELGVATGNMPAAAAVSIASLRGMRDNGEVTREEFRRLKSEIEGLPGAHQTVTTAPGAATATSQMDNLRAAIEGVPPGSSTTVEAPGLSGVYTSTRNLRAEMDNLDGRTVTTYVGVQTTGSAAIQRNANGTESATPGWSWVGEEGPELIKLRGGEKIRSAQDSARMVGGGATYHINVNGVGGNGDEIARAISDELRKLERASR